MFSLNFDTFVHYIICNVINVNILRAQYEMTASSKRAVYYFIEWFILKKDKLSGKSDGTLYFNTPF